MVNSKDLHELRRLTNAGLSDCKRALDQAEGDLFAAAISMLTERDVDELRQSMLVREGAGQSIKDPVTPSEKAFIESLEAHFIGQRTRPTHVGFLYDTTSRFLSDAAFRVAVQEKPDFTLENIWLALGETLASNALPHPKTVKTSKALSTVITMPESHSEWESDFIVLMHPVRSFLVFSSKPRVLAIYKRTKRPDRGVANIEEMTGTGESVRPIRHWVHNDLEFSPDALAEVVFHRDLREV